MSHASSWAKKLLSEEEIFFQEQHLKLHYFCKDLTVLFYFLSPVKCSAIEWVNADFLATIRGSLTVTHIISSFSH